jgi:hypothetical protein
LQREREKIVELLSSKRLPKEDRSNWNTGEWDNEPDRVEWRFLGFPCLARRGGSGNWCGYVAVSANHPWYEKSYDDVEANAHGGLTYSDFCTEDEDIICHVPLPGEPDKVWWVGFDTAHSGDLSPNRERYIHNQETYKNLDYVQNEIKQLARQAFDAKHE